MKNLSFFLVFSFLFSSCTDYESTKIGVAENTNTQLPGNSSAMITYEDHIYTVDHDYLRVLSIEDNNHLKEVFKVYVGTGIETVFAYEDYLYLGARTSIYIYDVKIKKQPVLSGTNRHFVAEDPVIVSGNRAYVTLKTGTENNNPAGFLEVVDVTNKTDPNTIARVSQKFPNGLGISEDVLYVCNAKFGIDVFELNITEHVKFYKNVPTDPVYDCIITNNVLIGQTKKGLVYYNIANKLNPVLIQKVEN